MCEQHDGGERHGEDDNGAQDRRGARVEQAHGGGGGVEHEGEFAALGEQRGAVGGGGVVGTRQAGNDIDAHGFDHHEGGHATEHQAPLVGDDAQEGPPAPRS